MPWMAAVSMFSLFMPPKGNDIFDASFSAAAAELLLLDDWGFGFEDSELLCFCGGGAEGSCLKLLLTGGVLLEELYLLGVLGAFGDVIPVKADSRARDVLTLDGNWKSRPSERKGFALGPGSASDFVLSRSFRGGWSCDADLTTLPERDVGMACFRLRLPPAEGALLLLLLGGDWKRALTRLIASDSVMPPPGAVGVDDLSVWLSPNFPFISPEIVRFRWASSLLKSLLGRGTLGAPLFELCLLEGVSEIRLLLELDVFELSLDAEAGLGLLKGDDDDGGGLLPDGEGLDFGSPFAVRPCCSIKFPSDSNAS